MIYRSNLVAPDLTPHFKHLTCRVMGHSFGHDVLSDWADKADDDPVFGIYKQCGLWTHDEAAILYHAVLACPGEWIDIGAHTGWTSAHVAAASSSVEAVDPMLRFVGFQDRFEANMEHCWTFLDEYHGRTSEVFFRNLPAPWLFAGCVIDGDHEPGEPLKDAQGAAAHLADTGVIIFHDFIGQPVREAVTWLMDHEPWCPATYRYEKTGHPCECKRGFHCRVYLTPHMVACCWRGDFTPPDHVPDPFIVSQDLPARCPDFDWSRVK